MLDRYAVFGHPIAHSKSPRIHSAFAAQTGQNMGYEAHLVPLDGLLQKINDFAATGGLGANITLPFKEEAYRIATQLSPQAQRAGAVNTLRFQNGHILGDNTDGVGLVRDLSLNKGIKLAGQRVLLLGAGGAARGVLQPLLQTHPSCLHIANRSENKAAQLAREFSDLGSISGAGYDSLLGQSFDLVINATSASLSGDLPPLPAGLFAPSAAAYDMMYGAKETSFLKFAREEGAALLADGLGMLIEQAAEAFFIWRGIRPDTAPLFAALRADQ